MKFISDDIIDYTLDLKTLYIVIQIRNYKCLIIKLATFILHSQELKLMTIRIKQIEIFLKLRISTVLISTHNIF